MTISDMSVVTSEVMVDETDIVSVKLGEDAEVTIDAIPGKFFKGRVTEVGTQAVLRSSGLASTQSTTGNQEAKDFKVVVTLQNPPDGLRPGLSSTAKIATAQKKNVVTIPIQALAERSHKELEEAKNGITVNVVNPSSIDENELTLEEARRIHDARFPIGRPPTVEDVAATVAFFASEEAEYVTGQVVNVSGGWMM